MLLRYLVKFKNQKSDQIFMTNVAICLTKIKCPILRNLHKNITLMILLKYVYNT